MAVDRRLCRQFQQMCGDVISGDAASPNQFVERWQCGRQLRAGDDFGFVNRDERAMAARIRAVVETKLLGESVRGAVHLPAGGAVDFSLFAKDLFKAVTRKLHLVLSPGGISVDYAILPFDVIPGMNAGLETGVAYAAQDICTAPADVGAWQQRTVKHRC